MIWLVICLVKATRKSIVTELSIRSNKHFQLSNIFLLFINRPYFAQSKNIKVDSRHYFVIKIRNTWEV